MSYTKSCLITCLHYWQSSDCSEDSEALGSDLDDQSLWLHSLNLGENEATDSGESSASEHGSNSESDASENASEPDMPSDMPDEVAHLSQAQDESEDHQPDATTSGPTSANPDCQYGDDASMDWQAAIEDLIKPKWPNDNWTTISRLLNIIGSTDRDADVILDSIRSLDWTMSIPSNVAELRRFELEALGSNKYVVCNNYYMNIYKYSNSPFHESQILYG